MSRNTGSTILLSLLLLIGSTKVSAQQHPHRQLARGDDLLSEMEKLHLSLSQITQVLSNSNIAQDDEIMSRTAKLIRRVRTLGKAGNSTSFYIPEVYVLCIPRRRSLLIRGINYFYFGGEGLYNI